jgi:hypothetical protein
MATLNEKYALRNNPHLLARISAALAEAAENVRNEQADFTATDVDDLFTLTAHGYSDGDKIEFEGSNLPTGLTAATQYFVRDSTANTFKVANTSGGAVVALTADGYGQVAVVNHPARYTWASQTLLSQSGPENEAKRAVWLVVQNATVSDQYTASPDDGGTTTDNDVQFVVNGLVDILSA